MRKAIFLAAFIVILVSAQAMLAGERFQASLNFLLANAQNNFRMNVERTFYGLSGEFFYQLPKSPVSFGVSLEYLEYGSETRVEPFSHDIPDVLVDVTTRNSVLTPAAVVRFSPVEGLIRPYMEVLAGFINMFTYTSVHDDTGLYSRCRWRLASAIPRATLRNISRRVRPERAQGTITPSP